MLEIGKKAPEFSLKAQDSKTYSIGKLKGKKIILYFYPKDDSPGCIIESCGFRDAAREFERQNAIILGISRDDMKSHAKFAKKYNLNFPILADVDGKACNEYGVWKEKNFLGKKYMGIERSTFIIDERGILTGIFRKVNPLGHAKGILMDVAMLRKEPERASISAFFRPRVIKSSGNRKIGKASGRKKENKK